MKTLIAACVLALAGAAQASTISGFDGPFAVANWTFARRTRLDRADRR